MNELIKSTLSGPIGWQLMWAALACVAILLIAALVDGWSHPRRS